MQSREYMLEMIQNEIATYIEHGLAIEGGAWKVYDPVMIGDVLDWMQKNIRSTEKWRYSEMMVLSSWKTKRKPLSDQDDECIRYVYSLLPTEVRK